MMDSFLTSQVLDAASTGEVSRVKKVLGDVSLIDASSSTGKTALWLAIERGNTVAVRTILRAGADVNKTYHSRRTPLMFAVDKGNADVLQDMFEAGAKLDAVDSFGMSALMIASQRGHLECLQMLLSAGASLLPLDIRGKSALMVAAEENRCECLKVLIEEGVNIHCLDFKGNSALMTTVCQGCERCLHMLVRSGACVDQADRFGNTPLTVAVEINSDILSALLKLGADVNLPNRRGRTPAILAAGAGRLNLLHTLIQAGADLDKMDDCGQTALMIAAEAGETECVECLISAGARQDLTDNMGRTALMFAAAAGRSKCLKTLLLFGGEWKDHQCKNGKTALNYAVEALSEDCVRELTMSGARTNLKDKSNMTVLLALVKTKCQSESAVRCLHILLEAGASPCVCDREGITPLMYMSRSDISGIFFQKLVQAGADIHVANQRGMTALQYAAEEGNLEYVKSLVDAGADINMADHFGVTSLGHAVNTYIRMGQAKKSFDFLQLGNIVSREMLQPHLVRQHISDSVGTENVYKTMEYLLEHGAQVNTHQVDGITPFMLAARHSDFDLLLFLINQGADINMVDKRGFSALHHVISWSLSHDIVQTCVQFLITHGANPNIRSSEGSSALTLALHKRNYSLLGYLLNNTQQQVEWGDFSFLIKVGERRALQMILVHGIVPSLTVQNNFHRPKENQSLLWNALNERWLGIAKFFLLVGYLNNFDVTHKLSNIFTERRYIQSQGTLERNTDSQLKTFLDSVYSHPWPLVKLCFVAVSCMMGPSPGREQRVRQSGLPDRLQRMLLFQDPISRLCVSQWDYISLCFNPSDYENLPKPRPLLFYWPLGRDLTPCDCSMCNQSGFRIA